MVCLWWETILRAGNFDTNSSNDNRAAVISSVIAIVGVMTVSRGPREPTRGAARILARHKAEVLSSLETCMTFSLDGVNVCLVLGVRCMDEKKPTVLLHSLVFQRDSERKS